MARSNYKTKTVLGAGVIDQQKYNDRAKSDKQIRTYVLPESISNDFSAATKVLKGNLCRILNESGSTQYVTFGDSSVAAPDVNTVNALAIPDDGDIYIIAPDDYIRGSAAMRLEIIED